MVAKLFSRLTTLSWLITLVLLIVAIKRQTLFTQPILTHNTPHGFLGWALVISIGLSVINAFIKLTSDPRK
ncbi:hypothetical protein OZX56_01790 [Lactobacillus sp. ESL0684]|uniref:hypothetical protein n=1 Tax=Lactobacillus sp. ESL0684 TaxID=2983213 RepID=UPI0023F97352|nr:hypothetical protein [Lactobacillus sp. ESL0684]WEV43987.1 hypothetical protein OZX56_01790 [Lactobacillus sp. ESL0684]